MGGLRNPVEPEKPDEFWCRAPKSRKPEWLVFGRTTSESSTEFKRPQPEAAALRKPSTSSRLQRRYLPAGFEKLWKPASGISARTGFRRHSRNATNSTISR